ncbi:MAG: RelA/SpoT family protein [Proteobacteria bacterium]|nr:RelA/SpoT family protein [Pseudomonadota bacterium]
MIRIEEIISSFQEYTENKIDCSPIQKAYVLAAKAQPSLKILPRNELQSALEVADVLIGLRLDIQCIVSGILNGVLTEGKISIDEVQDLMGEETASIVAGMNNIRMVFRIEDEKERIAEKMRQMVFASSKDIRIIFVSLAARLVRMRSGTRLSGLRITAIARETLQIYAPIADRLGLSHIKVELEDLCFSYIHPKESKELDEFRQNNEGLHKKTLQRLHEEILSLMKANKIDGKVKGRIKHNFSVYQKSKRIGVDYDQLHDLLGVRIIVDDIDQCYKVLGLINSHFQPVTESFKDYISFPKPNGYQSLHIDVYTNDGIGFDVQIRTADMDNIAERGVAAHWAYKATSNDNQATSENTSWLHDLSNSLDVALDATESLEIFTRELYSDFVYVFTPKGKIIKLQKGACVIDFAYSIHTEVGHTCVGAKINGRNVAIKTELKHGDKVEILTSSKQSPSRDWLHFAVTSRALSKIRSHLRKEERTEAEALGKEMFHEKIVELGKRTRDVLKSSELKSFLSDAGYADINSYYIHIGYGKINLSELDHLFSPPSQKKKSVSKPQQRIQPKLDPKAKRVVNVSGIDNMMVKYANCCNPVKGDDIVGLITQGQGVSVHLKSCENIKTQSYDPDRLIDVQWVRSAAEKLPVKLKLTFDTLMKTNLMIMKVLAAAKVDLLENNMKQVDNRSQQELKILVDNTEQLDKIISRLNSIKSVNAQRSREYIN